MSLQTVVCPNCNSSLFTDGSAAGMEIPCPECGAMIRLPGERAPSARVHDEAAGLEYEIHGQHPVQAFGKVHGNEFYFRSKWDEWTFTLSLGGGDPSDLPEPDQPGLFRSADGEGYFQSGPLENASYIRLEQAEQIIRACAEAFVAAQATRR